VIFYLAQIATEAVSDYVKQEKNGSSSTVTSQKIVKKPAKEGVGKR